MLPLVFLVLIACCSNVVFLEVLIRGDPGCGNLITFSQFLFVALEGFIFTSNFGRKDRFIPLKNYFILVLMFFAVSVSNNYALNFNISLPLHMIFRSGSLATNMVLGMLILEKRYSLWKYLSVVMITVGIFLATLASQKMEADSSRSDAVVEDAGVESSVTRQLIGIALLTFALFISSGLGIYQEILYSKFGKHSKEVLFYSHALPLCGFLFLGKDILHHSHYFSSSAPISLPLIGNIPLLWLYLLGNILTQYVCVRSVFTLSTYYSSLTVTLVITLRKFISLLFSIVYFQNPFTVFHWLGTFLVFGGTLLFAGVTGVQKDKLS